MAPFRTPPVIIVAYDHHHDDGDLVITICGRLMPQSRVCGLSGGWAVWSTTRSTGTTTCMPN